MDMKGLTSAERDMLKRCCAPYAASSDPDATNDPNEVELCEKLKADGRLALIQVEGGAWIYQATSLGKAALNVAIVKASP